MVKRDTETDSWSVEPNGLKFVGSNPALITNNKWRHLNRKDTISDGG